MATVATPIPKATSKSFSAKLWRRWQLSRRRAQARSLSQVRFRLTREGIHFLAVLLFIFLGAVIRQVNLLTLLAGAMIGLLVLQWRFNSRTLIGLQLKRRLPTRARVGFRTEVSLTLFNPKLLLGAWLVVVEDRIRRIEPFGEKLPEKGSAIVDEVRPQGLSSCDYGLTFHQRGRYSIGPSIISTRFPLGLGRGWMTVDNTAELLVQPQTGLLTPRVKSLFQNLREGQATSSPKSGMHEAEFYGLRPWQSGDSRRWIHWRTSARLGEIAVRQFERQQQSQICVLLDLYHTGTSDNDAQRTTVELVVSFAATLAKATAQQGSDRIAVSIAGAQVTTFVKVQSAALVDSLLDALAIAAPSPKPNLPLAVNQLMPVLISNPVLLIVSTRANQLTELSQTIHDPICRKLLLKLRPHWIDASAGEQEAYYKHPDAT